MVKGKKEGKGKMRNKKVLLSSINRTQKISPREAARADRCLMFDKGNTHHDFFLTDH